MKHEGPVWLANGTPSPQALLDQFDPEDLPEQFVLAERHAGPSGWLEDKVDGWVLHRHPTLPQVLLRDADREQVGWLLGYPIDAGGRLLSDGAVLDAVPTHGARLESWLADLGGRWLCVIARGPEARVHLDPTGSLSAVYSPGDRLVASTPTLIPYGPGRGDNVDLIRATGIPWEDAGFPLELTARHGVRRLLPNHHLHLATFRARRHWPTGDWETDSDVGTAVVRIAELTKRNVRAVVQAMPTYLPLTAGRDSRMLLATARDLVDELAFYTVAMPDRQADLDTRVAARISSSLGLDHQVVPYQQPQQRDLDEWMFRIGCGVGESRGWRVSTTYKTLDQHRARLVASLGEIARNEYWRATDVPTTPITAERLVRHTRADLTDETLDVAARWLAEVPTTNALQTLQLFYIEHGMGGWAGVFPYADYPGPGFILFPMNHAEIIRRMVALPVEVQRTGGLQPAVVAREWPELLQWGFNREYGVRRVRRAIDRRARRLVVQRQAA